MQEFVLHMWFFDINMLLMVKSNFLNPSLEM